AENDAPSGPLAVGDAPVAQTGDTPADAAVPASTDTEPETGTDAEPDLGTDTVATPPHIQDPSPDPDVWPAPAPTDPADGPGPTDPTDPGGTTDPTDPGDSTDPGGTIDPTDPDGNTDPDDPTDPDGTTDPSDPDDPTDPDDPPVVSEPVEFAFATPPSIPSTDSGQQSVSFSLTFVGVEAGGELTLTLDGGSNGASHVFEDAGSCAISDDGRVATCAIPSGTTSQQVDVTVRIPGQGKDAFLLASFGGHTLDAVALK
ncbi:MAG TPA: hypothetical protein VFZ64_01015, partial [Nocardioidaceae bacterium]